jgi:DNA-directed RNA polymerase specialized sigma subunit
MTYRPKWYDNKQWLEMMYVEKDHTMTEIGMYAGVSRETVRQLLIKYGLYREKT